MDASVFISSKKVFWLWVLSPLLIRFAAVAATYGVTAGHLARFEQAKSCEAEVANIQPEVAANDWLLKRYEPNRIVPLNERLYQQVADRNSEYGVNLNASVESERAKKSNAVKYTVKITGNVGSVYKASSYVADLLVDPLLAMQRGKIYVSFSKARGNKEEKPPETILEADFEKLLVVPQERGEVSGE